MRRHHEQTSLLKNRLSKVYPWARGAFMGVLVCCVFLLSSIAIRVAAQSTTINATLCDHQGPEIILISPLNQSTVNQGVVPLHAATTRTTQVDLYVNTMYSHTVALTYGEDLETEISLTEGKNNIELRAHFSCNQASATVDLIVYYDRDAEPGGGIDSGESGGGSATIIPSVPRTEISVVDRIADKLTGKYIFEPDYVRFVFNWVSFSIAVLGVYMIIYPKRLGNKVLGRIKNKRIHSRIDFMVRGIGVLIFMLAVLVLML